MATTNENNYDASNWKRSNLFASTEEFPGCRGRPWATGGARARAALSVGADSTAEVEKKSGEIERPVSYTDALNSRLGKCNYVSKTETTRHFSRNGVWRWSYRTKIIWGPRSGDLKNVKTSGVHEASSLKEAKEGACKQIYDEITPHIQMADEENSPKESVQGDSSQSSDQAENTIVTRDQGLTISKSEVPTDGLVVDLCSTEKAPSFSPLTKRWMLLDSIDVKVNVARGTIIASYVIPRDCYAKVACAPNLMPFEAYVYARPFLRLKFLVNANKFHCGKLVASLRFDDYQASSTSATVNGALSRPHVILDLTGNNEGEIEVPFIFHRAFVRTNAAEASNAGVESERCVSLDVQILSPLLTGAGGSSDIDLRVFFTFEKSRFAGMSYRMPVVQMGDIIEDILDKVPTAGLKKLIAGAEGLMDGIGGSNHDKPISHTEIVVVPRPRLNFCSGKGLSDAIPMRMNPTAQTSFYPGLLTGDEAKTTLDLARIWQLRSTFQWGVNDAADTDIYSLTADPWMRSYTEPYLGNPTLLELMSSMYAFASGTIDVRFDFVSNSFHTGTVLISVEFNRPSSSGAANACESYSTYTKTFHLGEQKSVVMRVPYIYDTQERRNTHGPVQYDFVKSTADDRKNAMSYRAEFKTTLRVRVVNVLRPVAAAPQNIEVLVFWRAGPNFNLRSLCQSGFIEMTPNAVMSIPYDVTPVEGKNKPLQSAKTKALHNELAALRSRAADNTDGLTERLQEALEEKRRDLDDLKKQKESADTLTASLNSELKTVKDDLAREQTKASKVSSLEREKQGLAARVRTLEDLKKSLEADISRLEHDLVVSEAETVKQQTDISNLERTIHRMRTSYRIPASFQMDSGEKEDEDPTAIFKGGKVCRSFQTTDVQLNIKDIIRQPVFLMTVKMTAAGSQWLGYFIPIRPPARDWFPVGAIGTTPLTLTANKDFNPGLGRHPAAKLLSLFRFWRGSNRLTFVFTAAVDDRVPIYIVHLPHSGAELYGSFATTSTDLPVGLHQTGLRTTMVIPGINNTEVVEFPYDTENNWSLMYRDNPASKFRIRDMGDYNAGHVVLLSAQGFNADVWWEAGDDFEFSNFYGPAIQYTNSNAGAWSDGYPSVQMMEETPDFLLNDLPDLGLEVSDDTRSIFTKTMIGMIPMVGMPYNIAVAANGIEKASKAVTSVADKANDTLATLRMVLESAAKQLALPHDRNTVDLIVDFALDILIHLRTSDFVGMGISFVRTLFRHLIGVSLTSLSEYGLIMGKLFSTIFSSRASSQGRDEGIGPALVGVFLALAGTIVGQILSPEPFRIRSFLRGLCFRMTSAAGVGYVSGVLRVTSTLFELGKRVVYWVVGIVDPEAEAIRELQGKSDMLGKFVHESNILMSECNARMLGVPSFRIRYWVNVMQAYQLQALLVQVPNNRVSPVLHQLCAKVIAHANERFVDISSSPIRYEPLVICIEGDSNIGKSFMTEYMVVALLKSIGVNNCESPVYYRQPGVKFWSAYSNQPVVVYDDWLNLNNVENVVMQVSELYQIKSTSLFIPDMAHLEDKRRKANPLVVVLLTNNAYPKGTIGETTLCPTAFLRRRDLLFHVASTKSIEQVKRDSARADVSADDRFSHLQFRQFMYHDKRGFYPQKRSYNETLDYLKGCFKSHHSRQQIEIKRRFKLFEELQPPGAQRFLNVKDPFTLFYQHIVNVEMTALEQTPVEVLHKEVEDLVTGIQVAQAAPVEYHEMPESPFARASPQGRGVCQIVGGACSWVFNHMCSPAGIMVMARATVAQVQSVLEFVMPESSLKMATCTDCGEYRPFYASCSRMTCDKTGHQFCRGCYRDRLCAAEVSADDSPSGIETVFGTFVRGPSDLSLKCSHSCGGYLKVREEDLLRTGVVGLTRLLQEKVITVDVFLDRVYVLTKNFDCFIKPFSKLTVATFLLRMWIGFGDPAGFVAQVALEEWAFKHRDQSFFRSWRSGREAGVQAEDEREGEEPKGPVGPGVIPDPSPGPSTWATDCPKFLADSLDENLDGAFDSYKKRGRVPMVCPHARIIEQSAAVRYKNGAWVICPSEEVVPDTVCKDNCAILARWEEFLNFLRLNWKLYRLAYQVAYRAYREKPSDVTAHELLARVPFIFLPKQIQEDPIINDTLRKEMENLCSGSWIEAITNVSLGKAVKYFCILASVSGVAYACYRGLSSYFSPAPDVPSSAPQGASTYNKSQSRHFDRQRATREGKIGRPSTRLQEADPRSDPYLTVEEKVRRNMFRIFCYEGTTLRRVLGGCGLYGYYAMIPNHYYQCMSNGRSVYRFFLDSANPKMRSEYVFDANDFHPASDTDFAIFKLPPSWPMFVDITKYIAKDEDLYSNLYGEAKIVYPSTAVEGIPITTDITISGTVNAEVIETPTGPMEMCGLLVYNFSKKGACGGLVMKKNCTRPIYAMHIAGRGEGTSGIGYGVLLTQEGLESFINLPGPRENAEPQCGYEFEKAKVWFDEDVSVEYVGVVDHIPYQPSKSKIQPSLLQAKWPDPPKTKPCPLNKSPGYLHDKSPLVAGTEKHGRKSLDFPSSVVAKCVDALWHKKIKWMEPVVENPARLSPSEACVGLVTNEYYEPLDLTTSSGYPWNRGATRGKVDYVTYERNEQEQPVKAILSDCLIREIEEKEALRRQGVVPATIFLDTLKDERRLIKKADSLGGTRVFCMSPLDYSIALRQNFIHFYAAFIARRWDLFHAVGIDANGEEWTHLTRKLARVSWKFIGIDYSNFGPAFNAVVAQGAAEIMIRWVLMNVEGVDETELRVLAAETTQSLHLALNLLYRQQCGSPSGAPDTTQKNTIVNMLYLMIAFYYLWPHADRTLLWETFFDELDVECYGDDVIMSVSEPVAEWFHGVSIHNFFARHGIVTSSADKLSQIVPTTGIMNTSFLKRWWVRHEKWIGEWHGALDKTSVEECCLWIWKSDNERSATDENCRASLELAYGWGSAYFNAHRDKMNDVRKAVGLAPIFIEWEALDRLFYPRDRKSVV